jgi:UDP-GlcNAc3NAcA epimerase
MKHVVTIVGARPQFIKAAPVSSALAQFGLRESIVHTGQHYDTRMSDVFFTELEIPPPRFHLGIGSDSHGRQTGKMLAAIEDVLMAECPDVVMVYGDTNSTLAGALAACKLGMSIAHVEAGLRSFNRAMPEEHNRILTDHCSSLLFCPSDASVRNLSAEGIAQGVHQVGDVMFDAMLQFMPVARKSSDVLHRLSLYPKGYRLATIHRPYNADDRPALQAAFEAFGLMGRPIIMPLHPRTAARLAEFGIPVPANVHVVPPVGYLDMLLLVSNAEIVFTDSGGVQKEACFAGVPCVTLRPETEWVETIASGWNRLAWRGVDQVLDAATSALNRPASPFREYGDGEAARRIATILAAP